jgi:polysaccharide pyruvyl transferase WcaK-like protein
VQYKRVGIYGWNGFKNIGDDAMLHVIVSKLVDEFEVQIINVWGDTKMLPILKHKVNGLSNFNVLSKIKGFNRFLAAPHFMGKFTEQLDVLIIGGGSLFHTEGVSKFINKLIEATIRSNPQALICALGVSIGPFYTSRASQISASVLNKIKFISVRDQKSLEVLDELKVESYAQCAPDLALLLETTKRLNHQENKRFEVGISLRYGVVDESYLDLITQIVCKLRDVHTSVQVNIYNFCDFIKEPDHIESQKLVSILQGHDGMNINIVPYSSDTMAFCSRMQKSDLMICMRLHASILAYRNAIKLLILPYHRKCIDFAKLAFGEHYHKYLIDKNDPVGEWNEKLENLLEADSSKIYKNRNELIKAADDHFNCLR